MYSSTNVHNDPERLVKDPAPGAITAQCSVTVATTRYKKLLQIQKSSKSSKFWDSVEKTLIYIQWSK